MSLRADYERELGVRSENPVRPPVWGSGLAATLPVADLASGSVSTFASSVDRLRRASGLPSRTWRLDPPRITASFSGDKMLRIDGKQFAGFAELSGFFPASDRAVRTHANYPHHRAALIATLELPPDADARAVKDRISRLSAFDIEDRCARTGAIAVAVRTEQEWATHDAGRTVAALPLVGRRRTVDGRRGGGTEGIQSPAEALPLRGIRVLDLTRVIAGPVATRALALLGADVLRIDSPLMPEIEWQHLENGQGKKSSLVDLERSAQSVRELLRRADVLVTGYRPEALARFGLDRSMRPGLVHGTVSAWGSAGPWRRRRGFDSIVQAASGISLIEGGASGACRSEGNASGAGRSEGNASGACRSEDTGATPRTGALPAQALDHATGYLLAAAVVDAVAARRSDPRGVEVEVSLARTAAWLLQAGPRDPAHPAARLPGPDTTSVHGSVRAARPALAEFDDYPWPSHAWGSDLPSW